MSKYIWDFNAPSGSRLRNKEDYDNENAIKRFGAIPSPSPKTYKTTSLEDRPLYQKIIDILPGEQYRDIYSTDDFYGPNKAPVKEPDLLEGLTQGKGLIETGISSGKGLDFPSIPSIETVKPYNEGFLNAFIDSLKYGTGSAIENIGQGMEWKGKDELGAKLKGIGEDISRGHLVEPISPEKEQELGLKVFLEPQYWATNIPQNLPAQAALMAPALGAGVAGALAGGPAALFTGATAGAAASRSAESFLEAGQAYAEAKQMGYSEDIARKIADKVFNENLKLTIADIPQIALTVAPIPQPLKKFADTVGKKALVGTGTAAAKIGGNVVQEGGEEFIQTNIQDKAMANKEHSFIDDMLRYVQPDTWTPEETAAAHAGGVMGGLFGGAGVATDAVRAIRNRNKTIDAPVVDQPEITPVPETAPEKQKKIAPEKQQPTIDDMLEVINDKPAKTQPKKIKPATIVKEPLATVYDKKGNALQVIDQSSPEFYIVKGDKDKPTVILRSDVTTEAPSNLTQEAVKQPEAIQTPAEETNVPQTKQGPPVATNIEPDLHPVSQVVPEKQPAAQPIQEKKSTPVKSETAPAEVIPDTIVKKAEPIEAIPVQEETKPVEEVKEKPVVQSINSQIEQPKEKPKVEEKPEPTPAPVNQEEKEPWQMTKDEFIKSAEQNTGRTVDTPHISQGTFGQHWAKQHESRVKQAIAESSPVPEEVLKDYPDLVEKQTAREEAEKPAVQLEQPVADQSPSREMFSAKVTKGAIETAPIYEDHKRGKNWLATIDIDPKSPGGIARNFQKKAYGDYKYVIDALNVGDAVEFGADYYSSGGRKNTNRWYGVVTGTGDNLSIEKYDSAKEAVEYAKNVAATKPTPAISEKATESKPESKPDKPEPSIIPIENARAPKQTPVGPFRVEQYEDGGWMAVDANDIAWFVSVSKEDAEKKVDEFNNKYMPAEIGIDKTPESGINYKKEEPIKQTEQDTVSPSVKIANYVKSKLDKGEKFSNIDLWKIAGEAFGGTQSSGKFTPKDAYDAMELGVNKWLLDQKTLFSQEPRKVISKLQVILSLLPTQSNRTAEMDEFQQFSTPPSIAYIASWVANISKNDTVLEPSAGIGGLATFGKIAGAEVIVNELSPRRAEVIKEMGFDRVFTENAEQLNNILPKDVKPTVVIMNPPFSSTAGRTKGKNDTKNAIIHIEQALKRLEPNGRLVAIVGRGMADKTPTFKDWWDKLRKEYSVLANIGINGKNYTKYGTSFDIQVVVIDKNGPNKVDTIVGRVDNLDDILPLLEGIRNERPELNNRTEQNAAEPTGQSTPKESETVSNAGHTSPISVDNVGTGNRTGGDSGRNRPIRNIESGGSSTTSASNAVASETNGPIDQTGSSAGSELGRNENTTETGKTERSSSVPSGSTKRSNEGSDAAGDRTGTIKIGTKESDKVTDTELGNTVYSEYQPQKLKVPGAKPHPADLVQSSAMASVEPPTPTYNPNLPVEIIKEGDLSIAQIEAVVYAGQAHQETLPDGQRRGFFVGDGTGVGKGREIASIILDNMRQGRKKAVWVTENKGLLKSSQRDYRDIGGDDSLIFEHGKIKSGSKIAQKEGIIFTTYTTLGTGQNITRDGELGSRSTSVTSRLEQLVNWLGEDFDGVIAFDEAHNMQNSLAMKGARGTSKPAAKALAGVELQKRLPNARVVYVSATGATEVENLAYVDRLGLWGRGTPFADKRDFISKIASSGLAAMELVARDMKAMGSYIARNIGFNGVSYSTLEHKLSADQREIYDTMAEGWQIVLQNINEALKETGAVDPDTGANTMGNNARAKAMSAFWGAQQRFFNQILTSMQMPSVIESIKKDLKDGKAIVLQLVNTNEAQLNRAMADLDEGQSLEDLDMTPRAQLMMFLEKSFPVWQYEEYTDDNGNIKSRPVLDSAGNMVENPEAVAMRDELLMKIGAMKVPDGPMEILFNEFGTDMVAEITGRSRRVVNVFNDETGKWEKKPESRTKNDQMADENAFMDDRKQILVFSDAGGTGRSYHADKTRKNQRPRKHYLIQAGWTASKAVQGFGRTHRSNQASAPEYVLATTDLKGQKRFMSSIARRLDQLGALTKGQRQAGGQGLFSEKDNLEGPMASDALQQFYNALTRGEIDGLNSTEMLGKLGLQTIVDEYGNLKEDPKTRNVPMFLNRLLTLDSTMQNQIFDEFYTRLERLIEQAIASGNMDTGMENFKADKSVVINEDTVYTDEHSGAETKMVEFEAYHKIKPLKFKEVQEIAKMSGFLGYYRNTRSGKVYAVRSTGNTTLSNGRVVDAYNLYDQDKGNRATTDADTFRRGNWEQIASDQIESLWNQALESQPEYRKQKVHLITGALLPIWDRLPTGRFRVVRVLTDDGRILLGRVIPERAVENTLKKLGASRRTSSDPQGLLDYISRGSDITLSNGWRIGVRRVSGEQRIEIIGQDVYRYLKELETAGVFMERIGYTSRFFIPTGDRAADILADIIKYRPVVEGPAGASNVKFKTDLSELSQELDLKLKPAPEALQRPDMKAANILVKLFTGRNLIPFRGRGVQGVADEGTIFINESTRDPLLYVVKHEIVHTLPEDAREELIALTKEYFNDNPKMFKHYRKQEYSEEEIWEEFTADVVSEVQDDPKFWAMVREQVPELIKLIVDIINDIITKFSKAVGNKQSMLKYIRDLEEYKTKVAGVTAKSLSHPKDASIYDFNLNTDIAAKIKKDMTDIISQYSIREGKPPEKTIVAYKLMRIDKQGRLFPLFVDRNMETPKEVWLDAKAGELVTSKTGAQKVKSSLGDLAYRPGWHLGDIPLATHIGVKGPSGKIEYMNPDHVWVECEVAADENYQQQANANGIHPRTGKFNKARADLKEIPADGYYRYKTNPNMTGEWIITGSMKIVRVLSDAEAADIVRKAGYEPLPRKPKDNLPIASPQTGAFSLGNNRSKLKRESGSNFTLPDEEVQSRMEAARGVKKETLKEKLKEAMTDLYRKGHREFEYLPRTGRFSELRNSLLQLRKQKGVAADKTLKILDDVTKNLNEYEYDIFTYKVIFDDLSHDFDENMLLPFGLTEDNFEETKAYVNEEAAKNSKVMQAVEKRREAWQGVKDDYIKAQKAVGFKVEDRLKKEDYYRHQVLEYANAKGLIGSGKKLKTPTGRGFLKQREGSSFDINTDYLQAEYEVMAQMIYDSEIAKVVKVVKQNYDIVNQLKRQAIQQNDEGMMEYFHEMIDKHEIDSTAGKLYRQTLNKKQAIAFSQLYKMAAMGELPTGPNNKFEAIVEEMAQAYWEAKHAKADYADLEEEGIFAPNAQIPDEMQGELFRYLNYLSNQDESEQGQIKARTVYKGMAEKQRIIKNTLGKQYVTWEDLIPEGYSLWQPRDGHMFFMANSIPEGIAEQLMTGIADEVGISADVLKRVMVVGKNYPELVVPEEVALTLENLYKDLKDSGPVAKLYHTLYRSWKQWQLISPRRYFKYNARNFTGDIDAVLAGNPAALKKFPQAWNDLKAAFFSKEKVLSPELQEWFNRGGFETLMQAQEINDINRNREFAHLMESRLKKTPLQTIANLPKAGWLKYWDSVRATTDFREALMRYATFLDYREQMKNNNGKPKNFGASNRDEIMGISNLDDRAAKLANELLGAYDEVSVIGTWLADNLFPFWRWNEVNFVRYSKLFRNAYQDGKLMAALAGKTTGIAIRSPYIAWKIGKFVLKAVALSAMITAWNLLFFPDEEKELPEDVKNRLHLVLGRDRDGKVLYFSRLGALQDFVDWFGFDTPIKNARDYLSGKKTIKETALDIAKEDANKVINAITPFVKMPVELLVDRKFFPDVFKASPIRDKWQYIADSFGLTNEYKALAGKPNRGYASSLSDLFIYKSDPYETAYWANKNNIVEFKKKIGTYNEGYSESIKSDALYNIKMAMRYNDQKAFEKYLLEYIMLGGTAKGLKQSLKSMAPLYGLSKENQRAYVEQLDAEGKESLIKAMDYYQRILGGDQL